MNRQMKCEGCFKLGTGTLVCDNCKTTCYCSEKCQSKDFEHHGPICEGLQSAKKSSGKLGVKKTYKCFSRWLDGVTRTEIPFQLALQAGATRDMLTTQPSTHLIFCSVEFDFNARSFLPQKKPVLVPVRLLDGMTRRNYNDAYGGSIPGCKHVIHFHVGSALVNEFLLFGARPETIRTENAMSESELTRRMSQCEPIDSSLLAKHTWKWKQKAATNVAIQHKALASNPEFRNLIVNALCLGQERLDRSNTHVVVIHIKTTRRLGDIEKLQRFQVRPILELAEEVSDELVGHFQTARRSNESLVVYMEERKFCIHPQLYQLEEMEANLQSETECTRGAIRAFVELTKVVLPPVKSPTDLDNL